MKPTANIPILAAKQLSFAIGKHKLLTGVDLEVFPGQLTAVLGANGAGKSTLFRLLSGEKRPSEGNIQFQGKPLSSYSPKSLSKGRAVLPQSSHLTFPFTVEQVVEMGRIPHQDAARKTREIVLEALTLTRTDHLLGRSYPSLSGGEQQRVQLARVLSQIWEESDGPRLLMLDEPTSSLDLAHQYEMLQMVQKFARQGCGVLAILHDLNLAAQYAQQLICLKHGKVVASGTVSEVLTPENIHHTFGQEVRVIPHPEMECPLIVPIPSSIYQPHKPYAKA
ncbi:MAG: heme ABC transporter ATP-binding protein [Bacteroidota bacterium]